jgi:hypothetical protein
MNMDPNVVITMTDLEAITIVIKTEELLASMETHIEVDILLAQINPEVSTVTDHRTSEVTQKKVELQFLTAFKKTSSNQRLLSKISNQLRKISMSSMRSQLRERKKRCRLS